MIKAIVFDCFGVLISDALQNLIDKEKDPKKRQAVTDVVYKSARGLIPPGTSRYLSADILEISQEEFSRLMKEGEIKNTELMEYILILKKKYMTAILSNVRPRGLQDRFTDKELSEHFDVVVGSGDIGFAKPEAEAYQYVADKLDLRLDECIMIDDREDYCLGAMASGMKALKYKTFNEFKTDLNKILDKQLDSPS